jgi:hypothetical protein
VERLCPLGHGQPIPGTFQGHTHFDLVKLGSLLLDYLKKSFSQFGKFYNKFGIGLHLLVKVEVIV